jgi:phosphonate transport system ATP-binding protein
MPEGFSLRGLSYSHTKNTFALKEISLQVEKAEQLAIIGPSGSGKTTLLHLLATAMRPQMGQLEVLGLDPWGLSKGRLKNLRTKIGLIHQAPPLPPKQRVVTAILAGKLGQWSTFKSMLSLLYPVDIEGAHSCLEKLDLGDRLFSRCDELSGGQLQRVGIARVLYQEPELMLADEPVSAMDPALSDASIRRLTEFATERNITFVASLHDVEIALKWFPRIIGLRAGQIMFDLPTHAVTKDLLRELYALEMEFLPPYLQPTKD